MERGGAPGSEFRIEDIESGSGDGYGGVTGETKGTGSPLENFTPG